MNKEWKTLVLVFMATLLSSIPALAQDLDQEFDEGQNFAESLPDTVLSRHVAYRRPRSESLLRLEPLVGVNSSNFSGGSGNYSFQADTGYEAGLELLVGSNEAFQFETGLLYAEHAGRELYQADYVYYSTKWQMNYKLKYLEVPLVARYNFPLSRGMSFFVKGGLTIAFLQDASGEVTNTQNYNQYTGSGTYSVYYNYGTNSSSSMKDYFSSTDTRWVAGFGGALRLSHSLRWTLQADYQAGLDKVSTSQPNGSYGTTSMSLFLSGYSLSTGLGWDI